MKYLKNKCFSKNEIDILIILVIPFSQGHIKQQFNNLIKLNQQNKILLETLDRNIKDIIQKDKQLIRLNRRIGQQVATNERINLEIGRLEQKINPLQERINQQDITINTIQTTITELDEIIAARNRVIHRNLEHTRQLEKQIERLQSTIFLLKKETLFSLFICKISLVGSLALSYQVKPFWRIGYIIAMVLGGSVVIQDIVVIILLIVNCCKERVPQVLMNHFIFNLISIFYINLHHFKQMIQKIGDYYVYEEETIRIQTGQFDKRLDNKVQQDHHVVGNVKQQIKAIRQRFEILKSQKIQQMNKQADFSNKTIFQKLQLPKNQYRNELDMQLYIPDQVLKLDQRISIVEQKLNPNQIFRRKIDQKGPLVQRIKALHKKLQKILKTSSEIITNNIQNFCASLEDKDEFLKIVFLKQALTKTQGLNEEINVLQLYLKNLNNIQIQLKAIQPLGKTVQNHQQVLQLRTKLQQKITFLFAKMKNQYQKISKEIEQINL